jgi:hypothetical protein
MSEHNFKYSDSYLYDWQCTKCGKVVTEFQSEEELGECVNIITIIELKD